MQQGKRRALYSVVLLADGAVLAALRPRPAALAQHLAHASTWITSQPDGAIAELVAAVIWLVAVWLGVGLLAGLLARAPGIAGTVARGVARVTLPRMVRQLVVGSLGMGIVLVPVAASASALSAPSAGTAAVTSVPGPVWPTTPSVDVPSVPAPNWPLSPAPPNPSHPNPTHSTPAHSTPTRRVPAARPVLSTTPASSGHAEDSVRVRAGDSLWQLAADRLDDAASPGRVTHYWQRIYAANRSVIGADPDHIDPGQQLVLPAPTAQELP